MFFGSYLFEFIGVLMRYLFQLIQWVFTQKKLKSFKELWDGPDSDDPINGISYGMISIFIGMFFLLIFILMTI